MTEGKAFSWDLDKRKATPLRLKKQKISNDILCDSMEATGSVQQ